MACDDLMQVISGYVLIALGMAGHQCEWRDLRVQRACSQLLAEPLGQGLQFVQRLRPGKAQAHLSALVKLLMKFPQGLLKSLTLHRQTVAVARMKAAQWMICRQAFEQRHLLLCLGILGPGDTLRVQHFALAQLVVQRQTRVGQHVRQAFQPIGKGCYRQLKEELGGALTGAGIDLATVALHVSHQPFAGRKALGAEKQQVFKKMRQSRPSQRHVMAAGSHL